VEQNVQNLVNALQGLPPALSVALISALPVIELRGGIIAGLAIMNRPVPEVFVAALIGNLASITPVIVIGKLYESWLRTNPATGWLVNWTLSRAERHRRMVDRWGMLGLLIFVGIPLPGTGAWTGTAVSILVGMGLLPTFIAIYGGTALAAVVVTVATCGMMAGADAIAR